jgi:hypothetical protein
MQSTGLAFFGTPHNGGSKVAKIALSMGFERGDNILEILTNDSIFADILREDWRHQLLKYNIVSFWGDQDCVSLTYDIIGYSRQR